ncbi:MAG: sigma-70 family RNA polymerase sigma factor [Planctomycetota bacterium]
MERPPREELDGVTAQWLSEAQGGDADGFARLYEHIAPALHTWAELRIRPEQRAVIEPGDLVQEVWFRAWRQLEGFDSESTPFRFWIFRIAKNVLLEATRQSQRAERVGSGSSERLRALDALADSITGVSMRLARDEGLARFRATVASLPPEEQKLVLHCGLEGLSYKEVAPRLGLSLEAVAKRWQRLRARLAESDLPAHLLADA